MKRNRLRKMKITEVSGVDRPASEGADIVFTKRAPEARLFKAVAWDESKHPRAGDGKFSGSGGGGGGIGTSSKIRSKLRAVKRRAIDIARDAASRAGMVLRSIRVPKMEPIAGGGVQFTVTGRDPTGSDVTARFQVHPDSIEAKGLKTGLTGVETALRILGYAEVPAGEKVSARRTPRGERANFNTDARDMSGLSGPVPTAAPAAPTSAAVYTMFPQAPRAPGTAVSTTSSVVHPSHKGFTTNEDPDDALMARSIRDGIPGIGSRMDPKYAVDEWKPARNSHRTRIPAGPGQWQQVVESTLRAQATVSNRTAQATENAAGVSEALANGATMAQRSTGGALAAPSPRERQGEGYLSPEQQMEAQRARFMAERGITRVPEAPRDQSLVISRETMPDDPFKKSFDEGKIVRAADGQFASKGGGAISSVRNAATSAAGRAKSAATSAAGRAKVVANWAVNNVKARRLPGESKVSFVARHIAEVGLPVLLSMADASNEVATPAAEMGSHVINYVRGLISAKLKKAAAPDQVTLILDALRDALEARFAEQEEGAAA